MLIIGPLFFQYCQPAQNQHKYHFLFHKNVSLRDFYVSTLLVHTWRIPWKHETSSSSHYLSARSLKRVLGKVKFMQKSICFVFFLTHPIQKQKDPYLYKFSSNRLLFIEKVIYRRNRQSLKIKWSLSGGYLIIEKSIL